MKEQVHTAITLDTGRSKKDGTFPVKLRLTYHQKQKLYRLGYNLTGEEFEKVYSRRSRGEYKKLQTAFNEIETEAIRVIGKMDVFTFDGFTRLFLNKPGDHNDVFFAFGQYIEALRKNEQINTAFNYEGAKKSFMKYWKKGNYYLKR